MIAQRILLGCLLACVASAIFARASRTNHSRELSQRSVMLIDWMRGLAAVAVLVGHVRGLFMQDYSAVRQPCVFWKAFYVLTGLGHQAVIVFFVLSGFLVGGTVLSRSSQQRWHFRDYLTRRLVRLYAVLIPGLLLTLAWDQLGLHLFGGEGLYGGHLAAAHLTMPDVRVTSSSGHFLGNLFFLQHMFVAPFGSNGPLWSLSYEFWAYLLFPLLVRAGVAAEGWGVRGLYLLVSAAILSAGGFKLDLYFAVWLMGAGLAAWFRRAQLPAWGLWVKGLAWLAFAIAVVVGRLSIVGDWYADPILGAVTAVLLGLSIQGELVATSRRSLWARAASWLAGFSYTLYVAHYPVLTFLFAGFMDGNRWAPSLRAVSTVGLVAVAIMLLYAYPLSRVTEAQTEWLRRRFAPKPSQPLVA
jgi:peptidoglycan/LPS O-acetylase OafA/YrhL